MVLLHIQIIKTKMSLAGKRVAILVEYNYEDLEVHYPLIRFKYIACIFVVCLLCCREENCDVFTVGPKAGVKYTGKYTYPCVSDKSIDEVKVLPYLPCHI